jgi:hypothetical protein
MPTDISSDIDVTEHFRDCFHKANFIRAMIDELYAWAAAYFAANFSLSDNPDLLPLLTQQQILALNLAISTNFGPETDDPIFFRACELQLDASQLSGQLSSLAASAVSRYAPNICALTSPDMAAILISFAGGVRELSTIPACKIKALGTRYARLSFGFWRIKSRSQVESTLRGSSRTGVTRNGRGKRS